MVDFASEIRLVSHGTCSYICMYINAVTNDVTSQLYVRYGFYNIIFKKKQIIRSLTSIKILGPQCNNAF